MNPYDEIFNEKLGELMKDIIYPEHEIYGNDSGSKFGALVMNALQYHTEATLSCSLKEYEHVVDIFSYLSPYHCPMSCMFVALQAVQSITPKDLPEFYNKPKDYIILRKEIIRMNAVWETIAAPYKKQAQEHATNKAKRDARELEAKSKIFKLNGTHAK